MMQSKQISVSNDLLNHEFQHFIDAQEDIYAQALSELKKAKKESHWMWFIFPQTPKRGMSELSKKFAIKSKDKARKYLENEVLGKRLIECTQVVLSHKDKTLEEIFGTLLDVKKFKSSMMLFSHVDDTGVFIEVLEKYS